MEYVSAINFLKQYKASKAKIKRLEDQLNLLLQDNYDIQAQVLDGMPKSPTTSLGQLDQLVELLDKQAELMERIISEKETCLERLADIETAVNSIGEPFSQLLHDKFIRQMNWEEIGNDLGYSAVHVRQNLYLQALQLIADYLKEYHLLSHN